MFTVFRWLATLATVLFALSAWSQVRIEARQGLTAPEERVSVLYRTTCRVVAEEFHVRYDSPLPAVTLVLGDGRDGVVGDESTGEFTIYLPQWDETMFATAVSRIALQHMISQERKARIIRESLRRARLTAPVSVDEILLSLTTSSSSLSRKAWPWPVHKEHHENETVPSSLDLQSGTCCPRLNERGAVWRRSRR